MSNTVMFCAWGGTYPGREPFALKHYEEFVEILKKLEADGEIERFETFLLTPYGGEFDGFTLIYGEPEKLSTLMMRDDLHRLQIQTKRENAKFVIAWATTGAAAEKEFALYGELVSEYEHVPELV